MHKIISICFLLLVGLLRAQSPQKISYQGVARNASGAVLSNTTIAVKFDIHRSSPQGTIVFTEQHQGAAGLGTNTFGLFTTAIGSINSLAGIDWGNGPFFMEVSIDPANGTSYSSVGTQELMSVPYALYAEKAGNATPIPTITVNAPNTITNLAAGSYSINIPPSVSYTAGNGIDISNGIISTTLSAGASTITGSGQAFVTSSSANRYDVNVPTPTLSVNGGVLTGAYPTQTLTIPASSTASLIAGNSNIILNQSGSDYTITPVTPTLSVNGGTLTGTYPIQTLTIPASSMSLVAGDHMTLNQSGNTYTLNAITPTLSVNGGTLTGAYPSQTLTIPASSTTTLTAGNSNITLNQSGNGYTITPVTPSLSVSGGTLTGAYPSQTLTIPSSSTTLVQGNNVTLNQSGNTYTISSVSPTITAGNSNITLNQSGNGYTITPVTPSLSVSGGTLTGAYPSQTLTIPSSSTTLVQGNNVTLNQSGNTYTISSVSPTITAGNSNITLNQSGNGYTITPVTPSLSVNGGTLTGAYPSQTLTIPSSSTTLVQGSNVTLNQSGNTYTLSASTTSLAAGNSNITLNQSGNGYTITPVTPSLSVSGGALTGAYPSQTLTIPSSSTTLVQGSNVTLNQSGNTYTLSASTTSLAAGNSNITLNQSGNGYTITPVTPSLSVSGGALTGAYPSQTLTIPSSSTTLVQGSNVTLNQSGNTYTLSASTTSLAAGNNNITLNQSGNGYTITPVTPSLSVNGGTLTGAYPSQTLTIPASSTTSLAAGNSNVTLSQSGNAYTITPVTPTLNVNGGTLIGAYPAQTLTIPSSSTTLVPGTNISLDQSGNTYTISSVSPTLTAGTNVTITPTGPANAYTISAGLSSYTGTAGNIAVTGNTVNLVATGVTAGTYGLAAANAVPVFSVDNFGRLTSAGQYTQTIQGDVTGNLNTSVVAKIRGIAVSATAPTNGQLLQFTGSAWTPVTFSTPWALTGNAGTTASHFIGTTDNLPFRIRTNNTVKAIFTESGQFLVGSGTGYGANSKLIVEEGHIESKQATAPAIAGAGSLLGLAGSSATLSSNSTDVCGIISIYTGLLGGGSKGNYATITFDKAYTNPPIIILTPRSEEAAGLRAYVTGTTATGFTLAFSTGTAGLATYEFNYMILESN